MKKQCQECKQLLDSSSFNGSSKEPDGLARSVRSASTGGARSFTQRRAARQVMENRLILGHS